jgi:hypothetical protein
MNDYLTQWEQDKDNREDELQSFPPHKIVNPLARLTNAEIFNRLVNLHKELHRRLQRDDGTPI